MGEESILSSIFKKMCKNVSFLTLPYSCVDGGIQLVRSHFGGRGGGGVYQNVNICDQGGGGGGPEACSFTKKKTLVQVFSCENFAKFF